MQSKEPEESGQTTNLMESSGEWIQEAFSIFETYHRESQLQAYSIFLCVALTPGITMSEIERKTNCAQSTVWRNINSLSEESDLVVTLDDPAEPRRKVVHLTKKGKKLARELDDHAKRLEFL